MQGSQKETGELDVIWVVVGILLGCAFIYFIFRTQIISGILWVKYFELKIISFFVVNQNYSGLLNWINQQSTADVQYRQLQLLSQAIGQTLKYPCMLISAIFAIIIYFKHPDTGYREIESMKTLAEKVKTMFPAINIISGVDLIKTPIDQGIWAMSATPIEFAKKYKLISRQPNTEKVKLDFNKAKTVFIHQLGSHFEKIESLKPHEQALFAIFSAFANYKREEAEQKMEEIAGSLTPDQLKSGRINWNTKSMLKKYKNTAVVKKIIKNHSYINTVFMELLTEARKSGIVLNSLYLWLKPIDRNLWYVLNNVGRKAVHTEAAAAQAHWLAEKRLGFAISQPMVDEAVAALDEAIQNRIIEDL